MKKSNKSTESDEEVLTYFSSTVIEAFVKKVLEFPLLTPQETYDLAIQASNGDMEAREKLINSNLRLVVHIAYRYTKNLVHLKIEDIVHEGVIGLIEAVDRYEPYLSDFSSYIGPCIEGHILDSIYQKERMVRRPEYLEVAINKYNKLVRSYEVAGKPLPSKEELCIILKTSRATVDKIVKDEILKVVSLDQKINEDSDSELAAFVPNGEVSYESVEDEMDMQGLLVVLKEELSFMEYYIFYNAFVISEPITLSAIAREFGLTPSRIQQIATRAKRKVKPYLEDDSSSFRDARKELMRKIGVSLYNLNTNPINPRSIIFYHYIKRYLTTLEQGILQEILFGRYFFDKKRLCKKFNVSLDELNKILESFQKKKNELIDENYKKAVKTILRKYQGRIFSVGLEQENQIGYEVAEEIETNRKLNEERESLILVLRCIRDKVKSK